MVVVCAVRFVGEVKHTVGIHEEEQNQEVFQADSNFYLWLELHDVNSRRKTLQ